MLRKSKRLSRRYAAATGAVLDALLSTLTPETENKPKDKKGYYTNTFVQDHLILPCLFAHTGYYSKKRRPKLRVSRMIGRYRKRSGDGEEDEVKSP